MTTPFQRSRVLSRPAAVAGCLGSASRAARPSRAAVNLSNIATLVPWRLRRLAPRDTQHPRQPRYATQVNSGVLRHALAALVLGVPLLAADLAPTGTLRASFIATNPVQGRVDPGTGEVTGPVADLVPELARRLNVPYTIVPLPDAGSVLDSVRAGRADIGFLAYEAARATQVDFSRPYALMGSAYAVRADSPIKKSAEVDRAGVKVGAVKGQSQQIYVSEQVRNARIQVLPTMPSPDALVGMLTRGEIDAFAANRQRMEDLARTSPRVRVLEDDFLVVGQAMIVPKGDAASLEELNRFLVDVLGSGFVKASLARADLAGVEAASAEAR